MKIDEMNFGSVYLVVVVVVVVVWDVGVVGVWFDGDVYFDRGATAESTAELTAV